MTNNLDMCEVYQQQSQNVQARGYCKANEGNGNGNTPNNEADCPAGQWYVVAPFNIPAPDCVAAPVTRDNHLGNDRTGNEVTANLTIPANAGLAAGTGDDAQNCVLRLRYNITTADTRACENPQINTEAACKAAGLKWSAYYVDSTYNSNNNGGNGPLIDGNPTVGQEIGLTQGQNGDDNSLLELAVNTNQFGRTFQDRSHVFSIRSRPPAIGAGTIYNLNVKGKRGNIVQTYPATEYDFHPVDMVVGANDYVHLQWTGNDNTNNNGNNNGEGTNNEDRHNIVQLDNSGLDTPAPAAQANMFDVLSEWNPDAGGARPPGTLLKQAALAKQTNCAANPNNDQQRTNCEKLNNAAATVDMGVLRFKPGDYKYMSTRNNNFSNRAQKAKLTTLSSAESLSAALPQPPTHVTAEALPEGSSNYEGASVIVSFSPPGEDSAYKGSDGQLYYGVSQEAKATAENMVYYWCDNSDMGTSERPEDWTAVSCPASSGVSTVKPSCRIDGLPEGVACAFQVRSASAGAGGWSGFSSKALAVTSGTRKTVPGAVIAVIVVAFLVLIGSLAYYFLIVKKKSGAAVPPPPGGKAGQWDNFAAPM